MWMFTVSKQVSELDKSAGLHQQGHQESLQHHQRNTHLLQELEITDQNTHSFFPQALRLLNHTDSKHSHIYSLFQYALTLCFTVSLSHLLISLSYFLTYLFVT